LKEYLPPLVVDLLLQVLRWQAIATVPLADEDTPPTGVPLALGMKPLATAIGTSVVPLDIVLVVRSHLESPFPLSIQLLQIQKNKKF